MLTNDNKQFQVTASYLLDLAQRAEMLFKESDEDLRQKLLEYVLSNIELKDKKLSYILNDPFRTVVETKKKSLAAHNSNIWCSISDITGKFIIATTGSSSAVAKTLFKKVKASDEVCASCLRFR